MATQPKNLKHPRPDCSISGWAAAWSELDRVEDQAQREALATLVRKAGFRGAPALRYCAQLARYRAGLTPDYPSAPGKLQGNEARLVESRVREGLAANAELFPFLEA
jgi:hypothetical protein